MGKVESIQITDGFQLTVGYDPLGKALSPYDQNGDNRLTVDDFRRVGETEEQALEIMWHTVADEIKASRLFKNPEHADRLLQLFHEYHQKNHDQCIDPQRDTFFQESSINAFSNGSYVGAMSIESLKIYGDIGLGTFDNVNGEQIHLDGEVYQALADVDNTTLIADDEETTPFSIATFFDADLSFFLRGGYWDLNGLNRELDSKINNKNVPHVFKIHASFNNIQIRSIPRQDKPHRPFEEVTKEQKEYDYRDVSGTLVAVWTPEYMEGIGVPGYHYHFISDDKTFGGHVLGFDTQFGDVIEVEGDRTCGLNLRLSKNYEASISSKIFEVWLSLKDFIYQSLFTYAA